ncbi:MAG TPA: hypothetical protein VN844_22230, partial [Pyrinomonadaceae bacterium]|nr:hypothetical protein [Pyrinomonadaceae bacterium]
MHLFPRRTSHTLGALLAGALMLAPSTYAQTPSPKTANSGVEPTPRVQALKSPAKSALQSTTTSKLSSGLKGGLDVPGPAAASFTNATAITITDCPNPCPASGQAASIYPSPITVSGEVGVVERVSITINGFSHAFPADVDFLLVSPSGRKSVLMSDFGAGSPGVSNINVTLDDYAARPIPSTVT